MSSTFDWRSAVHEVLAEEVGILADMIIDETLEELGINDTQLTRRLAGKFLKLLLTKIPEDVDRPTVGQKIGDILLAMPL